MHLSFTTQFTCFTGTKVQILTPELRGRINWGVLQKHPYIVGYSLIMAAAALGNGAIGFFFFEFHGVQMAYALSCAVALSVLGSQFTCFTGTKVQILTLLRRCAERLSVPVAAADACQVQLLHVPLVGAVCEYRGRAGLLVHC
jgi:hypothetical protein